MNPIDDLKLRTEIEEVHFPFQVGISSKFFCVGSCFSEVIGNYLTRNKINNTTNPFGVLFNPVSIAENLFNAITTPNHVLDYFVKKESRVVHYNYHSDLWGNSEDELAFKIKIKNQETREKLRSSDLLILTFGTAWVHVLKDKNKIVANCHKQNADSFSKRLISQSEFEIAFEKLFLQLKKINPTLKVLISVSPVIHSKEGLVGNSVSKSTLVYFSHQLANKYDQVFYFPGYEIMKEDLRDYRFYKDDLIHPSLQAENYILNFFSERIGDQHFRKHLLLFNKILKNIHHVPFDFNSQSYLKHLLLTLKELNEYPFEIDLKKEKDVVQQKINEVQKALST